MLTINRFHFVLAFFAPFANFKITYWHQPYLPALQKLPITLVGIKAWCCSTKPNLLEIEKSKIQFSLFEQLKHLCFHHFNVRKWEPIYVANNLNNILTKSRKPAKTLCAISQVKLSKKTSPGFCGNLKSSCVDWQLLQGHIFSLQSSNSMNKSASTGSNICV